MERPMINDMSNSSLDICYVYLGVGEAPRSGTSYGDPIRAVEGGYRLKISFELLSCYYGGLTWAIFDYVLTFNDELQYVWRRPMRAGSFLFYTLRYLGISSLLVGAAIHAWPEKEYADGDHPPCDAARVKLMTLGWFKSESSTFAAVPALQFSVFWAVELVLQSRIYALYGNKRRIAVFNGVLFTLEIIAMIVLWCRLPASKECASGEPTSWLMTEDSLRCNNIGLYWVPGLAFELWLAALALRKLRPRVLKRDLLSVIVRDSIKYFFVIAIAMVAHIISAYKGFSDHAVPFVVAGVTIGGSRMVLHLRRAYFRGHDASLSNLSLAFRTVDSPPTKFRFVDETFYVQEDHRDDEFSESEETP